MMMMMMMMKIDKPQLNTEMLKVKVTVIHT